jgi:2'-5' RNA ligase
MQESALVVVVDAAEPVVGEYRAVLDSAAAKGVPAHVTVLYPFLAPEVIDAAVLAAVREAVASVPRFEAVLSRVAWFGDEVVYLAPSPPEPLWALTAALWARFPQCPPYGGVFADVVPHLTVGHNCPRPVLAAAAEAVRSSLPVPFEVSSVRLMAGSDSPGSWRSLAEFALGSAPVG